MVVGRYGSGESIISGRSRCTHCRAQIAWYDNIPVVSFLMLRGRCRRCRHEISWSYMTTEIAMGVLFVLVAIIMGLTMTSGMVATAIVLLYCLIFAALLMIAIYDLRTMQIPMLVVLVGLGLIGVLLGLEYLTGILSNNELISRALGGLVGFGALWVLSTVSRERWMGAGDAYIGLMGGLMVGFSEIFFLLTVAFGLGAVVGIVMLFATKATGKTALPFAPFLIVATIITVLLPLCVPDIALAIPYFG